MLMNNASSQAQKKRRADDDFDAGRPVHPFQRFMHPLPTYAGLYPSSRTAPSRLARRALLVTVLGARRQSPAGAGGGRRVGHRNRRAPRGGDVVGGRELRGSGRRRRLVRSREEVGDRPARSGWFRDGCDGSARLMCGENRAFLAVIGFLSGMPRGKTPGRVFLRFRNGERNRAQTAKSSISPHIDPPARRPGSRSRRLRAAFGREAAGWRATVLRRLPLFCALGGSVAFVDVVGVAYPFPQ